MQITIQKKQMIDGFVVLALVIAALMYIVFAPTHSNSLKTIQLKSNIVSTDTIYPLH